MAAQKLGVGQAIGFTLANCTVGLLVLTQLPLSAIVLSFSFVPGVVVYPLMKRVMGYPQFILGVVFNSGVLIGYSTLIGAFPPLHCLYLYTASVIWTVIYDTVYAHQDAEDDVKIGVRSTALSFGKNNKSILGFLTASIWGSLVAFGLSQDYNQLYFGLMSLSVGSIVKDLLKINLKDKQQCGSFFLKSKNFSIAIALTLVISALLKKKSMEAQSKLENK